MASNDTTNLSELCVCLGIALLGRGYHPKQLESQIAFDGATIDDLYDLVEEMEIGITNRDELYWRENSGTLIEENPVYGKIIDRYLPTAVLISDAIYGGNPPDPWQGRYWISGGNNTRLEDGDPSDFMISDEKGDVNGFSLKDDSPGLFGGTTKHLLEFIEPEIIETLLDYDKARSDGKEFMQGKTLYTKDGKRLRNNIGYDWHLGAEEMYRNKAYEMCLQSLLKFFVSERRAISREASSGFMLYNTDSLFQDDFGYDYADIPSEFMIWSWEDDVRAGQRAGNRIPDDPDRWLAHFQPYNARGKAGKEHIVLFDAYWAEDYDPYDPAKDVEIFVDERTGKEYEIGRCEAYDSEPIPMTFLGIFQGNVSNVAKAEQVIIPLVEWWDEMDWGGCDSLGYLVSVQGINADKYTVSPSVYDPEKDLDPILFSPDVEINLLWTSQGKSKPMNANMRGVLHHFADYGCDDFPGGLRDGSGLPIATADYWMRRPGTEWVDREYDEEVAEFFGYEEFTQYDFWKECVFFNSSRKLSEGINQKAESNLADMDYEEQLRFLRFIFRVYENSYFYVNMHEDDTDIMRVPSAEELRESGVRIRDAIIPDAATVALRFIVDNYVNDECEININIVSGSGTAVFTDSPDCKISYRKNRRTAGLATVYEYIHCDEPPEFADNDLDS